MAFEEARAANPNATLLLNDFDMSTAYECLIEGVLEAGIQVDALGLQSHMHQGYWGEEKTLRILERFARFGLPIHLTESTLLSGHLMPPEIEDLNDYQIPILALDARGRGAAGRGDGAPLPDAGLAPVGAGHHLLGPVRRRRVAGRPGRARPGRRHARSRRTTPCTAWSRASGGSPPTTVRTDAEGRVPVRGFLGDYRVSAGGATAAFTLDAAGEVITEVSLA